MPPPKTITLAFQSRNGQFRLSVDPDIQFTDLLSGVSVLRPCNKHGANIHT